MNDEVDDMDEEELDTLERQIAARREDLTKTMSVKGMSDLIEGLLGDANPADYDHPEAGNWVGVNPIKPGTISIKKGARGLTAKTHRGDIFHIVVEKGTYNDD